MLFFIGTGVILIAFTISGLLLFTSTSSSKIKLSSHNLSTGSQSATPVVTRSANPWNIKAIAGCPEPLDRQPLTQKMYDYLCQQIADGKLRYPPTYSNGNSGGLAPVASSTKGITSSTVPSVFQTSGFNSSCAEESAALGFFDSNEGQHFGFDSSPDYLDSNANGYVVCVLPSTRFVNGQPTQHLLLVFYVSITDVINHNGIPADNLPKQIFDPVAGGALTITSVNGNILTVSDASGNTYSLNLGTVTSLPMTSNLN